MKEYLRIYIINGSILSHFILFFIQLNCKKSSMLIISNIIFFIYRIFKKNCCRNIKLFELLMILHTSDFFFTL